jgi:Peptidase A4 family
MFLRRGTVTMSSVSTRSVALVIVTVILWASAAVPAGAAMIAAKPEKSAVAGYIATTTVSTATATVTLPKFSCTSKTDLLSADVAVYDATDESVSLVTTVLACSKTKAPFYDILFDADGTDSLADVTVSAGDSVTMSISCSATSGTTVSVDDTTDNSSDSASSATPETCGEVFVGDEGFPKGSGKAAEPLPTFGSIDFSDVMVNGAALGSFSELSGNYDEGKKAVIDTGALTAGGTAFTTTQEP